MCSTRCAALPARDFISHVPDFSGHGFMTPLEQATLDRFGLDGAAATLQDFLIRGKFYSLFSLLFGIGFASSLRARHGEARTSCAISYAGSRFCLSSA